MMTSGLNNNVKTSKRSAQVTPLGSLTDIETPAAGQQIMFITMRQQ